MKYERGQNRGNSSYRGRHSGAGVWRFQFHQKDSRSQDRPARITGEGEGDGQRSGLGRRGSDSNWRNPASRPKQEIAQVILKRQFYSHYGGAMQNSES